MSDTMDATDDPPLTLDYGRPTLPARWFGIAELAFAGLLLGSVVIFVWHSGSERRTTHRISQRWCAIGLRQVSVGINSFCSAHAGRYPDSLSELVAGGHLSANSLVCPASADAPATFPSTSPTTAEVTAALAVPGHCSFIYVGRGLTTATATATTVVAYEPVSNHGDGCHVLYGDGSVKWYTARQAAALPVPATTTRPTPPF